MTLDELERLLDKNNIKDKEYFINNVENIFLHKEFQKRLTSEFPHHGKTTLGMHILEVAMKSYKLVKNKKNINASLVLKIAMMHDLYTYPWQNNKVHKSSFYHKHGFVHPIEAVINAINWYSDEFINDDNSKIIIDGILHHMYCFPVASTKSFEKNELELVNYDLLDNISEKNKKIILDSLNRRKTGKISYCKSKYKEGRIVRLADHLVSLKQITRPSDAVALVTGKNKRLK